MVFGGLWCSTADGAPAAPPGARGRRGVAVHAAAPHSNAQFSLAVAPLSVALDLKSGWGPIITAFSTPLCLLQGASRALSLLASSLNNALLFLLSRGPLLPPAGSSLRQRWQPVAVLASPSCRRCGPQQPSTLQVAIESVLLPCAAVLGLVRWPALAGFLNSGGLESVSFIFLK